jgi:GNAT superfamily N-acetyltransferase
MMPVTESASTTGLTAGFARDLRLDDGTVLRTRLLSPQDRDGLKELFARCSPESIRFRFLHPIKMLTEETLDDLTNVDGARHVALAVTGGAGTNEQIIAVGRYQALKDRPEVAEISFLVEDAWQRRGIGTRLLQTLVELALRAGITRFSADVLSDNLLMLAVFRRAGYALCSSTSYGVTHLEFPIVPQPRAGASVDAQVVSKENNQPEQQCDQ